MTFSCITCIGRPSNSKLIGQLIVTYFRFKIVAAVLCASREPQYRLKND